jgi:hypothetical protein
MSKKEKQQKNSINRDIVYCMSRPLLVDTAKMDLAPNQHHGKIMSVDCVTVRVTADGKVPRKHEKTSPVKSREFNGCRKNESNMVSLPFIIRQSRKYRSWMG